MIPCLPVTWPRCFAQSASEQNFRSDRFKTVASPHTLRQLHEAIQAFSVASRKAILEVAEDGLAVVLNGEREGQECFVDVGCDLAEPSEVLTQGLFFCGSFIDAVKGFFELVGGCQAREVVEPCFHNQRFALVQVMSPPQQQEAIMHQGSALLIGQALACLLTDRLKATRKQLQNMKLIYNQCSLWQGFTNCMMVTRPHIGTNHGDSLFDGVGQALQIGKNGRFVPVPKQLDDTVIADISNDTTVLVQQVQFVNAQVEQLAIRKSRLDRSSVLTEERADRAFDQASFVCDADKGSSQGFLLDVVDQSVCHEVILIHRWQWLKEGTTTKATQKAMALHCKTDALASNGQVHIQLRLSLMAMQLLMAAMEPTTPPGSENHVYTHLQQEREIRSGPRDPKAPLPLQSITQEILIGTSKYGSKGGTITTGILPSSHALLRCWDRLSKCEKWSNPTR